MGYRAVVEFPERKPIENEEANGSRKRESTHEALDNKQQAYLRNLRRVKIIL